MKKKGKKASGRAASSNNDEHDIIVRCEDIDQERDAAFTSGSTESNATTSRQPNKSRIKFEITSSSSSEEVRCRGKPSRTSDRYGCQILHSTSGPHEVGSCDLLSQRYESLDYDICENVLYLEEQKKDGYKRVFQKNFLRWIVIFFIAILTALTACFIVAAVDLLSDQKYKYLKRYMDECFNNNCLYIPFGFWLLTNAVPVMVGSIAVTYFAPVAAGSGIPLIKCYLNGVKVPEVVRVKTFLAKAVGVVCSVVGGLAVGKEGPMIHCGAVIAAGISQGKSTTFKRDFKIFENFRQDREKRDFVSAGRCPSHCYRCS